MDQMQAALAHLKALKKPSYAAIARRFKVDGTTLRRRFLKLAGSRAEKASKLDKNLTSAQEVLLNYIDKLTDRNILPTAQIIRNLAEELLGDSGEELDNPVLQSPSGSHLLPLFEAP